MAKKYYIKTIVEYSYESDVDEFASKEQAEEFGWKFDEMMYDGVYSIEVEVEDVEDEDDEE